MEQIGLMLFPVTWEMLASGDMEILFPLQWAPPSHMAELQILHWQQAEGMETQAKSFVADGAKCHHLRHGFSQCWEIMEGVLRCQDCHHPFPLPSAWAFREIILVSHSALIWPMLLEVLHKHCIINVMPSSVSRGSDFGFLPPAGGLGKWRDKHGKKPIKLSLAGAEAASCAGLEVVTI